MEPYRRRPHNQTPQNPQATASAALDSAGQLLRRLLPFPSSAGESSLQLPLMPSRGGSSPAAPAPAPVPSHPGRQAATIVSEAASILDEEMARGVIAARATGPANRPKGSDSSNALLRQVHDLIDNVAQILPSLQSASAPWMGASEAAATNNDDDSLPELKPASDVRPGERVTIATILCNKESRPVRLVPGATDLLGSGGGRIPSHVLEFIPRDLRLEPGDEKEMEIAAAIPLDTGPGCYSGILVVSGVDYLRALITIKVV